MTEQPKYEILRTVDGIEIRRYPKLLVAMTTAGTSDSGFDYLFATSPEKTGHGSTSP
jgi:hypothetical protein